MSVPSLPSNDKQLDCRKVCFTILSQTHLEQSSLASFMAGKVYPGYLQSIVRHARPICVGEPMRLMRRQQAFSGPLMRVRRKAVRRCDRHAQLGATTGSDLWRAKFSLPKARKTSSTLASWALWPRGHHSPGPVVAEDSSVRAGWHSKWRGLVLACSASLQALQPSHAESKETSHERRSASGCRCTAERHRQCAQTANHSMGLSSSG
jgi:hypothetical protein